MQWHEAVNRVHPYVYRISTPTGTGTGFLVAHSDAGDIFGVATAAHVVSHAHEWEQPIRLEHFASGETIILRPEKRAIIMDSGRDTAAILFEPGSVALPRQPPELFEEGMIIKTGVEVGWLGFPAVSSKNLCFFSGRISAALEADSAYLVDGVAINGVSGGPTLWLGHDSVKYIGFVSAYMANRASGETLPGLAVVRDVTQFHDIVKRMRTLDEARAEQAATEAASEIQARQDAAPQ